MYHGTTVDELMQMVETAERHAQALADAEAHELELAAMAWRSAEEQTAMVGAA